MPHRNKTRVWKEAVLLVEYRQGGRRFVWHQKKWFLFSSQMECTHKPREEDMWQTLRKGTTLRKWGAITLRPPQEGLLGADLVTGVGVGVACDRQGHVQREASLCTAFLWGPRLPCVLSGVSCFCFVANYTSFFTAQQHTQNIDKPQTFVLVINRSVWREMWYKYQ